MPIVGYLKTSDPGRISTLTNADGDPKRRKKLEPIRLVSNDMYLRLYVLDCSSHTPRGAVVPVILKQYKPGTGWEELGKAICCPLCWRIIIPPVGANLPEAQPLVVREVERRTAKKVTRIQGTPLATQRIDQITQLAAKGPISSHDVAGFVGINRPTAVRLLQIMVKMGRLEIEPSYGGRGRKTIYKLKKKLT